MEDERNKNIPNPGASSQNKYISLKDAIEIIHRLDGKNIPVKNFIESCKLAGDLLPISAHPTLINLIKTKLEGDAKNFLINRKFNTLEDFFKIIQNVFGKKKSSEHYIAALTTVIQNNNETVIAYSNKVRNLLEDIEECIEMESTSPATTILIENARKTALKCFIRGLKTSLETRIPRYEITTLDEAITKAIIAEQEFLEKQELLQNLTRQRERPLPKKEETIPTCTYCERRGHATNAELKNAEMQN